MNKKWKKTLAMVLALAIGITAIKGDDEDIYNTIGRKRNCMACV